MRTLTRLVVLPLALAAFVAAGGCGDKADNSKIQSPGDKPLGAPTGFGGDKAKEPIKGRTAPINP